MNEITDPKPTLDNLKRLKSLKSLSLAGNPVDEGLCALAGSEDYHLWLKQQIPSLEKINWENMKKRSNKKQLSGTTGGPVVQMMSPSTPLIAVRHLSIISYRPPGKERLSTYQRTGSNSSPKKATCASSTTRLSTVRLASTCDVTCISFTGISRTSILKSSHSIKGKFLISPRKSR